MRFSRLVPLATTFLKATGLYRRGVRNALAIEATHFDFVFPNLPMAFDGYRIVHLSDLHLDFLPETTERVLALLDGCRADLCLFSGDYRVRRSKHYLQIMEPMARICGAISVPDGYYAVLGNHDCLEMIESFEAMGINVLVDQSVKIRRADQTLTLSGVDGRYVGFRHLEGPKRTLEPLSDFAIALTHAPDLVESMQARGYSLYLAGHTHGGQICMPGGRPIMSNVDAPRAYIKGRWQAGDMQGYTNSGVSVSSLPVRFNTRGEVATITLRRRPRSGATATAPASPPSSH